MRSMPLRSCLGFVLLSQLLFLLSSASAIRSVALDVPTSWQKIYVYNNRHSHPVRGMSRWTKGLRTYTLGKTLTADDDAGDEVISGDPFQLSSIDVGFNPDGRSKQEEKLTQDDIYRSKKIHKAYVQIPPKTKLTRWQLVATVAGHEIGFEHFVDTHGNEKPPTQRGEFFRTGVGYEDDGYINDRAYDTKQTYRHSSVARAVVLVGRQLSMQPIHYGSTKIRIKHMVTDQYLTVFTSYRRLTATLQLSPDFHFIMYSSPNGTKVKTLNPLQPRHEWLSASAVNGRVYFAEESARSKVYWTLNKEGQLYDGDAVTFSNNYHNGSGLCYFHRAPSSNVYSMAGRSDEWILEAVDATTTTKR